MIILGIETSCDESALALLETANPKTFDITTDEVRVINSLIHSQAELHSAFGGVYPNLAKREHSKNIVPLLHKLFSEQSAVASSGSSSEVAETKTTVSAAHFEQTLQQFKASFEKQNPDLYQSLTGAQFLQHAPKIDAIAVTEGPGLEPTLWVGINFARFLAELWNVPIIPINHMEGHIIGSLLANDKPSKTWQKLLPLPLPALALLISGGHTEIVKIEHSDESKTDSDSKAPFSYTILGQTKDDAVGEAYDKVARLLDLPYPGGPHISKLSHEAYEAGIASPLTLPRPMIHSGDLHFSFSGIKTAVLYAVRKELEKGPLTDTYKKGLAFEFEMAVRDTIMAKMKKAVDENETKAIIVGGGVSANHVLRGALTDLAKEYDIPIYLPSKHISGDNALMIALAGALHVNNQAKTAAFDHGSLRAQGTMKLGTDKLV